MVVELVLIELHLVVFLLDVEAEVERVDQQGILKSKVLLFVISKGELVNRLQSQRRRVAVHFQCLFS